jgi:hypothetical protein
MPDVRLKINMIIGGKFHARGSVMDESLVPENLRKPDYINQDPGDREGKVLLLRDLSFQSLPRPMSDGVPTSFPTHCARGELFDLALVPASKRESLVEGLDYKTDWTFEEAEALQKAQEDVTRN